MWLADHVGFDVDTYRVDNSYLILNDHFELPTHQEGEVIVDYQYCVQAVEAIRKVILDERHPVNYITEVNIHCYIHYSHVITSLTTRSHTQREKFVWGHSHKSFFCVSS